MLLSAGTILGCLLLPVLAARLGRRGTLAFYFVLMFVCIALGFGYVFLSPRATPCAWFMACLFFLGIGGANFAVYTLWLPEQYRTECRGSAFAFATSFGRFIAAGVTFLVGAGVARMHTIGTPGGAHFRGLSGGPRAAALGRGDQRQGASRLNLTHLFDLRSSAAAMPPRSNSPAARSPSAKSTSAATAWRTCSRSAACETGDRLCVYLANCVEMIDLYLACVKLGVIFVPINILYRDREMAHILRDAEPAAVVAAEPIRLARAHLDVPPS